MSVAGRHEERGTRLASSSERSLTQLSPHAQRQERLAEAVVARVTDALNAWTLVVDHQRVIIASSRPGVVGASFDAIGASLAARGSANGESARRLSVPVSLDDDPAEVIVLGAPEDETSTRLARALIGMIAQQATLDARLPNQREIKNKFIHDLLRGASGDEESLAREGQILGMDLSRPRAVILIDASSYILAAKDGDRMLGSEEHAWRCAQRVINIVVGFFSLRDDTICAYIGDGEVAVLKASGARDLSAWADPQPGVDARGGAQSLPPLLTFPEPGAHGEAPDNGVGAASASWADLGALKRASAALLERLRRETGAPFSIGVGRYHPGIRALAASYQDAHAALTLGRHFRGPNQAHCLDGLGVAAFVGVADERTKLDLATHLLSPLDHEAELIETLTTFFAEDCSPSATANRLTIHRNTLSYRLDKISALTGLDPRHFDDAVQIRLALTLRALHELPAPAPLPPTYDSAPSIQREGSAAM